MRRGLIYLAVCALWGALGMWPYATPQARAEATAAAARDPNQAAAEVLGARYQRVDDGAETAGNNAAPNDATSGRPRDARQPTPTRDAPPRREASATSTSFGSLVWIVLALVVILAVAALVISPGGSLDVVATAPATDDVAKLASAAPVAAAAAKRAALTQPRQTADQLAAEGKFADAIHALLQQTLGELVMVANHKISDAATSREIARQLVLPPSAGEALAALIGAVERTHFGDEVPAPSDYAQCRATFEVFAHTYRGGAAPKRRPGAGA